MKTSSRLRRLQRIRKLRRQRRTFFVVVMLIIMMMAHSAFSKTDMATDGCRIESVRVTSGDTLWSIAEEYKPEGKDLREFVYEIANDNGLSDCGIYCGQILYIPVSE